MWLLGPVAQKESNTGEEAMWRKGITVTDRTKSQESQEGGFQGTAAHGQAWPSREEGC